MLSDGIVVVSMLEDNGSKSSDFGFGGMINAEVVEEVAEVVSVKVVVESLS